MADGEGLFSVKILNAFVVTIPLVKVIIPFTVTGALNVTPPPVLAISRSENTAPDTSHIACASDPLRTTLRPLGVNVPPFDQLPATYRFPEVGFKVKPPALMVRSPATPRSPFGIMIILVLSMVTCRGTPNPAVALFAVHSDPTE